MPAKKHGVENHEPEDQLHEFPAHPPCHAQLGNVIAANRGEHRGREHRRVAIRRREPVAPGFHLRQELAALAARAANFGTLQAKCPARPGDHDAIRMAPGKRPFFETEIVDLRAGERKLGALTAIHQAVAAQEQEPQVPFAAAFGADNSRSR
jgi:hypothetical protein